MAALSKSNILNRVAKKMEGNVEEEKKVFFQERTEMGNLRRLAEKRAFSNMMTNTAILTRR